MTTSPKQVEATQNAREEWRATAPGWRTWHHVLDAPDAGARVSAKLVELAGIGPGDRVLDVAGGYGEPSLTAARAAGPEGEVVCVDVSPDMLAFGRERAAEAGLRNVRFVESDAASLELEPSSFDAVLSRAGLMFFPDVEGLLGRLREALVPGGRFAASVWGAPPNVQYLAAIPVVFRELQVPPGDRPDPSRLADPEHLRALVEGAGLREVTTGTMVSSFETESPEAFTRFMYDIAPRAFVKLVESQPQEAQARVWEAVTDAYRGMADADGRVRTRDEVVWVAGTK